jgi:hypothetical protein
MKTYTLTRTGMPPLRFQGEIIAEADTQQLQALRWYKATVYQEKEGRFVVEVGFRSSWEGEAEHDWVTVCHKPSEVAFALKNYDVLPPGRGYPPSEAYQDRQAKLRSHLQRDYDGMVSDLLDDDIFVESLDKQKDTDDEHRQLDWIAVDEFLRLELACIPLTKNEACAVCDANNGAMLMGSPWAGIVPNLMDTEGLDGKWNIDTVALSRKLRHLTRGELFALSFGIARFWRNCELPTDEALKKAGFVY